MANERLQGLLSGNDPLFNIGMGILANNQGNYGAFGPAIGRGFQQGVQQTREAQQALQQQQQQEMQMEQMRRAIAQQQRQEEVMRRLPQQLGIDADILQAYPGIGQKLIEQQFSPQEIKAYKPGDVLYQGGKQLAAIPREAEKMPSAVQEYQFAKTQGYPGSFVDFQLAQRRAGAASTNVSYGSPVAGVDAAGNPVFFQPAKGGGAPAIVPGVRPEPKPEKAPTEMQAKAGTFYNQMVSASGELGALSREGFDPASLESQAATGLASGITNPLVGEAAQRARQAQEQWAESFLRVKTGAAATKDEVDRNIRTFFPKFGDSPQVLAQKARARQNAEQDVLNMTAPEMKKTAKQAEPAKPRTRADILKQYGVR